MFEAKYIISENCVPVVFSEDLTHADVARSLFGSRAIVGAGFCTLEDNKYVCYGKSISLGVVSRGPEDEKILNLYFGLTDPY